MVLKVLNSAHRHIATNFSITASLLLHCLGVIPYPLFRMSKASTTTSIVSCPLHLQHCFFSTSSTYHHMQYPAL